MPYAHYVLSGLNIGLGYADVLTKSIPADKFAHFPGKDVVCPAFYMAHLSLYPHRALGMLGRAVGMLGRAIGIWGRGAAICGRLAGIDGRAAPPPTRPIEGLPPRAPPPPPPGRALATPATSRTTITIDAHAADSRIGEISSRR